MPVMVVAGRGVRGLVSGGRDGCYKELVCRCDWQPCEAGEGGGRLWEGCIYSALYKSLTKQTLLPERERAVPVTPGDTVTVTSPLLSQPGSPNL